MKYVKDAFAFGHKAMQTLTAEDFTGQIKSPWGPNKMSRASLASIAGTFVAVTFGISPSIGLLWTLKALIVVVLAGTGSILGALPAGILLGVVEALSGAFVDSTYREVIGLVIFLLVLVLRPQGLFTRNE